MLLNGTGLGFGYHGGPWLFRNLNLTIEPGQILGISGYSGCGKSTLSKILAGYLKPQEGELRLGDKPIPTRGVRPVQLIHQHPEKAVNPRWKIGAVLNEAYRPDENILEHFGINTDWLNRWPGELSGGELQRCCIARAFSPQTRYLIADEMTSMFDAITQAHIWHAVREVIHERGMGLILISHERALVNRLCDDLLIMTAPTPTVQSTTPLPTPQPVGP
jgi:peptide/nickel transport system ATP-binding protein